MSKLRTSGRRRPLVTAIGLVLGLVTIGVFAGSAGSVPQRGQEMPTPRGTPGIVGKPQEGETLNATGGQWLYADGLPCSSRPLEPCNLAWQWQRCNPQATSCADIAGATTEKYLVVAADVGGRIRIVQTLTKNDCDAHGKNCRDVASPMASDPTNLVAPKPAQAPKNRELPAITGTPMEEETLAASTGLWEGPQPISVSYQWYRCDREGNNCGPIAGANAQTYKLVLADVGATIRVTGTAHNEGGDAFATSQQTPVIAAFGPTAQRRSTTIDRVAPPHRLVIDQVEFKPTTLKSLKPFAARFRVSDTRGFRIQGALVQVLSVPFGLVRKTAELQTNAEGWATFTLTPTAKLELKKGASLFLFLRARKPGENPEAGVSNRRLVWLKLAAPATK